MFFCKNISKHNYSFETHNIYNNFTKGHYKQIIYYYNNEYICNLKYIF